MILSVRKGATAPFSCLPARMGSGKARNWVKGLVPCGFLGQRPKPSESFSESISTVFKVHLSLFFAAQFFIDYLTLPIYYNIFITAEYSAIFNKKIYTYTKYKKGVDNMFDYSPLWKTLEIKGITQYQLINRYNFSTGTLDALRKNKSVTVNTIENLCLLLDCTPNDILRVWK